MPRKITCKKILFAAVFLCLLSAAVSAQQIKKIKIGELAAYIAASKKPLLVNFWATWCTPCIEEIPFFISTIKEKYNGKIELLLVSLDAKKYYPVKLDSVVKERKFTASVIWLDETDADVFCPFIDSSWSGSIPASLFINNGKQYRKFFERALTQPQLEKELKLLTE